MAKNNKTSTYFKSYTLQHKANPSKVDLLFNFYSIYKKEYKIHVQNYWSLFINNQIKANKFSHLGSTKNIITPLNSAYLQVCLSQACTTLNNYLANISEQFNNFLSKSTIKDNDLLHKLRTINFKSAWLNKTICYYPELVRHIVDDFGNLIPIKYKQETIVDKNTQRLAKKIFFHIVNKQRVNFPNLNKPKLVIDSRLYSLESSKKTQFNYWLKISTHVPNKRVSIPIKTNKFFDSAQGNLGKTIELDFQSFDYQIKQYKHSSFSKPKGKNKGLTKVNRKINFIFNKQHQLEELFIGKTYNKNIIKDNIIAFDLGLCNFLVTSDGELYGKYWLTKLTQYDKKILELSSTRQSLGLKTRSKRYDRLIGQIRGFIKSETNRILNNYFERNQDIKTVVIEKLRFTSPNLSKRLNRIIQNCGYQLFKEKLEELSLFYGFTVEGLNPAYTSQECSNCDYVDVKNRKAQDLFKCLCCGRKINADVNGGRTNLKRFKKKQNSTYKLVYKSIVLRKVKLDFVTGIESLVSSGVVGRRYLYGLLKKNRYFKEDIANIESTAEVSGLKPMTVLNYDKKLSEWYMNNMLA